MTTTLAGQTSLFKFEEDFMRRSLGSITTDYNVALTELVANAWDSGASYVSIIIPESYGMPLVIEDDGIGMTSEQFRERWMTLRYNRLKHQGEYVEFPPERAYKKRRAYGRNGVGRHSMLCFSNKYTVETWKDGKGIKYIITTSSGKEPFTIINKTEFSREGHGTKLTAIVENNLPYVKEIRELLAARFLYDPEFEVVVNNKTVPLSELVGFTQETTLTVNNNISLKVYVIDSTKAAKTTQQHGIAFWVGNKLVGQPSWTLSNGTLIDGRTKFAKRYTIIVMTEDLRDQVLPDWSGFKDTEIMDEVCNVVGEYAQNVIRETLKESIQETKEDVIKRNIQDIKILKPWEKREVSRFLEEITEMQPTIQGDFLSAAIKAVINLEKSRSGIDLLQKLATLSIEDIESLNMLLDDWSVKEVLNVMEEIDRRISVINTIERLCGDKNVDELHTLHPLVTQARWLFGPEFDSPMFSSNSSLKTAINSIFKDKKVSTKDFINYRKRPDIVVLGDSTISAVCTDDINPDTGLSQIGKILIIEVKKGGFDIGREEMTQAEGYIQDIYYSGAIEKSANISAFVVGHKIDQKTSTVKKIGDSEYGVVHACTYNQLVRTASNRLFNLKNKLQKHYDGIPNDTLIQRVLDDPQQQMNI